MDKSVVTAFLCEALPDVETEFLYGYEMFFYKSDRQMAFATLIEADTEHDRHSNLDRPGVYRLNFGMSKATFQLLFPSDASGSKQVEYDYTAIDMVMPHPEYAAYHFACVLSPSEATFDQLRPLLTEGHQIAARRYEVRAGRSRV